MVSLPDIKIEIYIYCKFQRSIDFKTLSIITGVSQNELTNLNPGYSTWILDPSQQIRFTTVKAAKAFNKRYNKFQDQSMRAKYIKLLKR